MVVRHGAHARRIEPGGSTFSLVRMVAVGGLAVAALTTWLVSPGAHLAAGRLGLARVSLTGLETHIRSASYIRGGRSVRLVARGGELVPSSHLTPGTSGVISVAVAGPSWLSWLPWESESLKFAGSTPALPVVSKRTILRPLGSGLKVAFNEPVSSVQYHTQGGRIHRMNLAAPKASVVLPLPAAKPGQQGALMVTAKARNWESYAPASRVQWASIPYVTVSQTKTRVTPTGRLVVQFSQPIKNPNLANWKLAPSTPGQWKQISSKKWVFTPAGPSGYGPGALVQLTIPGGSAGPQAASGSVLQRAAVMQWTTPPGSVTRLQELLAEEGYLPVTWKPTAQSSATPTLSGEDKTIYNAPSGQFTWAYPHLPAQLQSLWSPGQMNVVTKGAIMQFEATNGLPVDGIAGPAVWKALIQDRLKGITSPAPYTYIFVTETLPETLELWSGDKLVLTTKTNTGIPATPTYLGTSPIYERLKFQIMRGKNPNGVRYADPVYWINYFKGGDAVHGFVRSAYGFPQSLGCVEVPPSVAQTIYDTVNYGTLVTVNPVGVPPAPAH